MLRILRAPWCVNQTWITHSGAALLTELRPWEGLLTEALERLQSRSYKSDFLIRFTGPFAGVRHISRADLWVWQPTNQFLGSSISWILYQMHSNILFYNYWSINCRRPWNMVRVEVSHHNQRWEKLWLLKLPNFMHFSLQPYTFHLWSTIKTYSFLRYVGVKTGFHDCTIGVLKLSSRPSCWASSRARCLCKISVWVRTSWHWRARSHRPFCPHGDIILLFSEHYNPLFSEHSIRIPNCSMWCQAISWSSLLAVLSSPHKGTKPLGSSFRFHSKSFAQHMFYFTTRTFCTHFQYLKPRRLPNSAILLVP